MSDMTPSNKITDGQIEKVLDQVRSQLRKNRQEIPAAAIQYLLSINIVAPVILSNLMHEINLVKDMISFKLIVDSSVDYAGIIADIAGTPKRRTDQHGQEVELFFFRLGFWVSDEELVSQCSRRGLKLADPYTVAQFNFQHEGFLQERPNVTVWQEDNGEYNYVAFGEWRRNHADRENGRWSPDWWFVGVRE